MQMTTDARAWLDAAVRRILARHPLGDAERAGITYEIMSHLHAGGETHAAAAGRSEVTRADLETALADAGGEAGLAAAFVAPLAKPVARAGFGRRALAFLVDAVLLGIALTFVHGVLHFLLLPFDREGAALSPPPAIGERSDVDYWGLMPWGFHDPAASIVVQAVIAAASAALVVLYFTWTEGHDGRSLGKRALDLRVLRADGQPVTYRDAFVRNVAKLSFPLLVLDVLVMLLANAGEKQRASDRIAGTIVVRA